MKNLSIVEFTKKTASNEPVPGGGSIAALSGALSAALAEMVASVTEGSKKYEDVKNEMIDIKEKANLISQSLLDDIEKDSKAFTQVMDAYKLPKETDEQKKYRGASIQNALKLAAEVPLSVAMKSYDIMDLSQAVVSKGNQNAVTDGMVSAMMARTAVLSALLNVKINLSSIKDEEYVRDMNQKAGELEKKAIEKEKEILSAVML
ncbi:MAG: cyclodeaminase/cyclohydrolase family protein [Clostridia bacterium]|nr:cyclodeaminase/cyclohydrolase family protein [Clostridia bacterium]